MNYNQHVPLFFRVFIVLLLGIWLLTAACSGSRYYNRYPKEKTCKLPDNKTKGWKK